MDNAICLALFLFIFAWIFSLLTKIEEKTTNHETDISILNGIKDALSTQKNL